MTASVSWAALQVPELASSVDLTSNGVTRSPAVGQPLVEVPAGPARSIKLSWAEAQFPNTNEVAFPEAVTGVPAVGTPAVGFDQQTTVSSVSRDVNVGAPIVQSGAATVAFITASAVDGVSALGQPSAGTGGLLDGTGTIYGPETTQAVSATSVSRTPAIGQPSTTHELVALPTSVVGNAQIGSPRLLEGDYVSLEFYGVISQRNFGLPALLSVPPVVATSVGSVAAIGAPALSATVTNISPTSVAGVSTVGIPAMLQVGGAIAPPVSDISTGPWTSSDGGVLFDDIDEPVSDDSNYISTTAAGSAIFGLAPIADPGSHLGHVIRYRIRGNGATNVRVALLQGPSNTEVAGWTHTPAPINWVTYEQTLTTTQAGNITDYTALRLEVTAS
jgi:hypothetical protein